MSQAINWFPGHMRKALNETAENLKQVDLVYETCDARIPFSSRNPELSKIIGNKPRIVILNKADLADPVQTDKWIAYLKEKGIPSIAMDASHKKGIDKLISLSSDICSEMLEKAASKGRTGKSIRVMVVGVPNTGKSTLINSLCGRKVAVTGDRPGVTRQAKWLRTDGILALMDMPGVLWPKIATKRSQLVLTATGAVKTEVTDSVEVAYDLYKLLCDIYPLSLEERYEVSSGPEGKYDFIEDDYDRFLAMAKKRGCILSGGRIDEERFSKGFLDDFRQGRIGRITLESPTKER